MATGHQTSKHVDEDMLELYAMGRLPAGLSARMRRHLHVCAWCGQRLSRTQEFIGAIIGALRATASRRGPVVSRRKKDS